ncbi:MAG: calcium-binding protein, partial [Solirubrobacterales bacterium]
MNDPADSSRSARSRGMLRRKITQQRKKTVLLFLLVGCANLVWIGSSNAIIAGGGSGNDTLNGNNSADTQLGRGGSDILNGSAGADTQYGGSGADTLNGGTGNDVQLGGSGNDTLSGGSGNDLLSGGAGSDQLSCGSGSDTVYVGANDTVQNCVGDNIIRQQPNTAISPVSARLQWDANFGYCGETSVIAAGMSFGQYTSQWTARSLANPGVLQTKSASQLVPSWPSDTSGKLLPPPATGQDWQTAAEAMSLDVEGFDTYSQLKSARGFAATNAFLAWVKTKMVAQERVIIGVMNNTNILEESGDGDAVFDHVVPVLQIGSEQPFAPAGSQQTYYGSDTITIGDNGLYTPYLLGNPVVVKTRYTKSNFSAGNTAPNALNSTFYTNTFDYIQDDRGGANTSSSACGICTSPSNCNAACSPDVYSVYDNTYWSEKPKLFPANLGNYGFAISGVTDPQGETVPVSLTTSTLANQPLNNEGVNPGDSNQNFTGPAPGKPAVQPSAFQLKATVGPLTPGVSYNLDLYDSFISVPTSDFNDNSAVATERWKLNWDPSEKSWSTISSTAQGWTGSCQASSC